MDADLEKDAISTHLMCTWTGQEATLSQAGQENLSGIEKGLVDSLLRIFDESERFINLRIETPL